MKKFLFLMMAVAVFAISQTAGAQEYLWFGEEVHELYTEDYDFIENGIYYHILDSDTPEVAVMNHNTIYVHVGAWMRGSIFDILYSWPEGDYSGDLVIPEEVEHDGVSYQVVRISCGAFVNCKNLTSVSLPQSIRDIRMNSFMASGITRLPDLPRGIELNEATFSLCPSITLADMSDVENLGGYCFTMCENLECVILPDNTCMESLLTNLQGCKSLKHLYHPSVVPPAVKQTPVTDNELFGVTLYVPEGSEELYRNAYGWNKFKDIRGGTYAGVKDVKFDEVSDVRVSDGKIVIEVKNVGDTIEVYTSSGRRIRSFAANGTIEMSLPSGMYIVRTSSVVTKVIL